MSIEKRNFKMKNVLIVVLLAAITIVALGGVYMLQQDAPMRGDEIGRSFNPMQFESAQTGPTGRMVMSTGIVLLLLGLGVLVLLLWVGWKQSHYNSSGKF
jgi:TRAP-type C4-dicarboxylate transport system permease small subunit